VFETVPESVYCAVRTEYFNITQIKLVLSGFGGAEVECWPLIPKFAGSNPADF
jgi:hypothetical protein